MTREQAKREIDFLDYYLQNHTDDYGEESHTAMMMAIQALEQQSSGSEIPNNCDMRDATLEERESIDKYIKSISKPTGVKFGALEQEPSGDLISRGEVLENAFKIYTYECGLLEVVGVATIETLPSINPQEPKWIPVSERLPEKGYSVWVTRTTDDNCKYVRIASYQGDCWMDNTDEFNKPNPHKVIAWQPLPTPYEPQERSE